MADPRHETAEMLARQVLAFRDLERAHPGAYSPDLGRTTVRVEIQSMVRGICKEIWIDSAAIASTIEAQVKEAVSQPVVEKAIAEAVATELQIMYRDITRRVRAKIEAAIDRAVDERLGNGPLVLAKKITDKMWDAFSNIGRRGNIYGDRKGSRTKKR